MEQVNIAIQHQFYYYLSIVAVNSVAAIIFLLVSRGKETRKFQKLKLGAVLLLIASILILVILIVPFAIDCMENNVIVVQGTYRNEGRRDSAGKMGIFSVELEVDGEILHLETAALCKDFFPAGEYYVTAYYFPTSKKLLYIDIAEECVDPTRLLLVGRDVGIFADTGVLEHMKLYDTIKNK